MVNYDFHPKTKSRANARLENIIGDNFRTLKHLSYY